MVTLEIFLLGLLITSTLTGLATEAVKKVLTEHNSDYPSNTLAGFVALVISAAIGVGYVVLSTSGFTTQLVVSLIALIFMSWLCAMVGYDKVVQAISQFKTHKGE
jgi:ABC-type thiamin/hydroxymethylpyrimidine transport system permease subunit